MEEDGDHEVLAVAGVEHHGDVLELVAVGGFYPRRRVRHGWHEERMDGSMGGTGGGRKETEEKEEMEFGRER